MRIASLVPSATEICGALGLADSLVGVTHECDHPPGVEQLPQLTRSVIADDLSAAEIDAAVLERTAKGEALYELDTERLASLDVDLIFAQQVCAVCAVSYDDVLAVAERLPTRPVVISLDPSRLPDVLGDVERAADAAGDPGRGVAVRGSLQARIEAVSRAVSGRPRPRVAALEWLDPPYAAGHWVPEMIDAAGGVDALAQPGQRSRRIDWTEIAAGEPELVVVMPCGIYCPGAVREALAHAPELGLLGARRYAAVDAAASFSRPGPRLADGVELLGHLLHPEAVPDPPGLDWRPIDPTAATCSG